jgi:2-oxoisovalerate dehydrogenase E2 component (dihydrolipoyl transacylase)
MTIFHLPDLGEGLPDAEIREWYVKEGDTVKVDQPMVAMETAKAVVDVPAPQSGKIIKLFGKAGDVIITGAPLVEFEGGEKEIAQTATVVGALESTDTVLIESATGIAPTTASNTIKAIPAVRMLAKKLNVDLAQVKATGAGGQITLEDVERATSSSSAAQSAATTAMTAIPAGYEAVRGVRRAMAMTMAQSHSEVVPITLVDDANIHAWPEKTDTTARMIRAITAGCKAEPALNAWFDGKVMARKLHQEINLGIAVDAPEGLFVPVIKDVANKSAAELRTALNTIKEQVKARTIPQEDLKGATIVLSNVGVFAGRYATPIISLPTVAILATGRIREEVVAQQGKMEIHRLLPLSLSIDHRAVTGGEAARFLAAVIQDLQQAN